MVDELIIKLISSLLMIDPVKKAKISAVTVFLICGTLSTLGNTPPIQLTK